MATQTERLGLKKAELNDKLREVLTTMFNENWEKIDELALDVDLQAHIEDEGSHVTKDGKLQTGLNAEMVGGKKVEELAPAEHDHNDLYYTKQEVDSQLSQVSSARRFVFYRTDFSNLSFFHDFSTAYCNSVLAVPDTAYGGIKCVSDTYELKLLLPFKIEDDSYRTVLVFSFDGEATYPPDSCIGLLFSFANETDAFCAAFEPGQNAFTTFRITGQDYITDRTVLSSESLVDPITPRVYTKDQELSGVPVGGPVYIIDVTSTGSGFKAYFKKAYNMASIYEITVGSPAEILASYELEQYPAPRQSTTAGMWITNTPGLVLHYFNLNTASA